MWYLIVSGIVFVTLGCVIWIRGERWDRGFFLVVHTFATPLVLTLIGFPLLGFTTGLLPTYSTGERCGYVTKISYKGIIFKTYEAQIQVGTGKLAAIQKPFAFSLAGNKELAEKLRGSYGSRICVNYQEWLIQPFRLGATSYSVVSTSIR